MSKATSRLFSVLLPITRPPVLLPFAIESVLEQSIADFELLIVCDGAPPETVACGEAYAERDARVKVFSFPKGARHGEAYRHQALLGATSRYVAQICDDDLWLPNHLEEMERLLSAADFGNLLHVYVRPNGALEILPGDLALPEARQRMVDGPHNLFGLSVAGYRLETYRRLPEGWAPAPPDIWTDLFMWRKFLAMEGLVFATRAAVTALHFAAPERDDATLDERQDENSRFLERIRDPRARSEIIEEAWHSLLDWTLESDRAASRLVAEQTRTMNEVKSLDAVVAHMSASRDALQEQLAHVTKSHEDLEAELMRTQRLLAAREIQINGMLRSTSWRLTAPLRKIITLTRRAGGRSDEK